MFRTSTRLFLASTLLLAPSLAFCDSSFQDSEIQVNGATYSSTLTVPGLDSSGFSTATGQGVLQFTVNPGAAGSYSVDAWIWDAISLPFFNEYGVQSGSAAAGQSWQIDIPDYESSSNHSGTIIANTDANALDNTNHIPGGNATDNYSQACSGSNCNDFTSMAMGFNFNLTASQTETVSICVSSSEATAISDCGITASNPLVLEQIHPVDGNNTSASDLFLVGDAVLGSVGPPPPPPTTPEPASWGLLAAGAAVVGFVQRRRVLGMSAKQEEK